MCHFVRENYRISKLSYVIWQVFSPSVSRFLLKEVRHEMQVKTAVISMTANTLYAYICRITFRKKMAYIDWLICFDKIWYMNMFTKNAMFSIKVVLKRAGFTGSALSLSLLLLIIGDNVTLLLWETVGRGHFNDEGIFMPTALLIWMHVANCGFSELVYNHSPQINS